MITFLFKAKRGDMIFLNKINPNRSTFIDQNSAGKYFFY